MTSISDLGPRRATFRGPFRAIARVTVILVVLFSLTVAYRYWETGDTQQAIDTASRALFYWFGLTAVLAAIVKLHATHIHEFGLAGRNFWGFPVRLRWVDIQGWRLDRGNGIPAVVLLERNTRREMWIFREVFFSDSFQEEIRRFPEIPIPEVC